MSVPIGQSCRDLSARLANHADALSNSLDGLEKQADEINDPDKKMQVLRFLSEGSLKAELFRKTAEKLAECDREAKGLSEFFGEIQALLKGEIE